MFDSHPISFQKGGIFGLGKLSGVDESGFIVKFSFKIDEILTAKLILATILNDKTNRIEVYITSASVFYLFF